MSGGVPHQIPPGTDGWCTHTGAIHQNVPGCGRVCSDSTGNRGVFSMTGTDNWPSAPCSACPDAMWSSCGGGGGGQDACASTVQITGGGSLEFLGGYSNDVDCRWLLICSTGAPSVTFNSFATESNYDFLNLFDGDSTAVHRLSHLHGTDLPDSVTASGRTMLVQFTADGSAVADGFHASMVCGNAAPPPAPGSDEPADGDGDGYGYGYGGMPPFWGSPGGETPGMGQEPGTDSGLWGGVDTCFDHTWAFDGCGRT